MKCVLHVGWHEINPALCVGFRWMWTLDKQVIVVFFFQYATAAPQISPSSLLFISNVFPR